MTMSVATLEWIGARGLDPEIGVRLGVDGTRRGSGDCVVLPFIREGRIVARKYRFIDPAPETPRFTMDKGGTRCAWNEDCLRDDSLIRLPLIITEGEMDAWVAVQCGLLRSISVPNGARDSRKEKTDQELSESHDFSWMDDIEHLLMRERVTEVILATDGDSPGIQLMNDLARRLGKYRCKFLVYPQARDPEARGRKRLKDLNEVLQEYGSKGVVETISRAQFVKVNGIAKLSEMAPSTPAMIFDIPGFPAFQQHYKMRLGDFVVVTGVPGSGKTTWIQDAVLRVSQRHDVKVAWGSFEQDPQQDHKRNFRRWYSECRVINQTVEMREKADAWIDRNHVFIVPDDEEESTLEWVVEKIETAVLRYGCQIVVIDPFNEIEHRRDRSETETEYIGRAIRTFKRAAKRLQIHLILVAHPAKMQRDRDGNYPEPTLYDIAGSAHFFNKCDLGIVIHRTSADETKVKTAKSRYHDIIGEPGSVAMAFCKDDGRFRETERLP